MPTCYLCSKEITFSSEPEYITVLGKKIPLDIDPSGVIIGPHDCHVWRENNRKRYFCRNCQKEIYFDDKAAKSKYGKMIPQDIRTLAPHQCDKNKIKTSADNTEEEKIAIIKAGIAKLKEARK